MNHYLVDRTREHMIEAAAHAVMKEEGDLRIQILARPDKVLVQACAGGIHKTWLSDSCDWDDLATSDENLLIPKIDGVLFRLERQAAGLANLPESRQQP